MENQKHINDKDLGTARLYMTVYPNLSRGQLSMMLDIEQVGFHDYGGCATRTEYINLILDSIFKSP